MTLQHDLQIGLYLLHYKRNVLCVYLTSETMSSKMRCNMPWPEKIKTDNVNYMYQNQILPVVWKQNYFIIPNIF